MRACVSRCVGGDRRREYPGRLFVRLLSVMALLAGLSLAAAAAPNEQNAARSANSEAPPVYLFWSPTCPHCAKARAFLEKLAGEGAIALNSFELGAEERHDYAFVALNQHYRISPPAVPLIALGDDVFVGFGAEATTGAELRRAVAACRETRCADVVGGVIRGAAAAAEERAKPRASEVHRPPLPQTIRLPLIGSIDTGTLSLPALTIVLGLVDGFNPCAMWVLVFLIGLLVGMRDAVRMWSYGIVFLLTSAIVYLAFMAAWLNVLMLLGSLTIIRAAIGVFAIGAGGYYLWQFWSNPGAACPVTTPGERQRVMTRLKAAVAERSFVAAVAGIVVLAVLVNLIELLCSAGIPAVYTQVLALSDLSGLAYAGYLLLYITVFLIDDIIVFVTAMLTLQAMGLATTYARYSHLIGGVALGFVGILLLVRPEWLMLA